MALNLSLSEILVNLERQIESLREQIGLHAREEEHHREQRALREAELEQATTHLESFRSVAAVAADLDFPVAVSAAPPPAEGSRTPSDAGRNGGAGRGRPSRGRAVRYEARGRRGQPPLPPGAAPAGGAARRLLDPPPHERRAAHPSSPGGQGEPRGPLHQGAAACQEEREPSLTRSPAAYPSRFWRRSRRTFPAP
jgi:hypothetical protein